MLNTTKIPSVAEQEETVEKTDQPRKPYFKPLVEELGDLRTLTLGGSPGASDSGTSFTTNWPI